MWKKEDVKIQGVPEISTTPVNSTVAANPNQSIQREAAAAPSAGQHAGASVSQGIRIKGEVTGTENLFVDGQIEGKLDLGNASVTIGPNGVVKADVTAREVIVRGRIDGKVVGSERIQISSTGQISGEIHCERIAIEDGAVLRGRVETGRPLAKTTETRSAAAGAGGANSKNLEPQKTPVTTAAPAPTASANAATAGPATE
jgi:cytoskeletal protein CcmA (bactofilin family)